MRSYLKIICGFFILFLIDTTSLFSQNYSRRQLSGLYDFSSGGIPMAWYGNMEVMGTPATSFYKLYIRPWGRYVLKQKHEGNTYVKRFLFMKGRPKQWGKYRGRWKSKGDTLYLKRGGQYEAYKIQFYGEYKVLGIWKIYKYSLTNKEFSFMKVWKDD